MKGDLHQSIFAASGALAAALAIFATLGCDRAEPAPPPPVETTPVTDTPTTRPDTSPTPPSDELTTAPTTSPETPPATQPTSRPSAKAERLAELVAKASTPPDDPTKLRFAGLVAPKPASWQWKPPENTMRLANFTVPAPSGGGQAQLAVFIAGGDGPTIVRGWEEQFRTDDGEPAEAALSEMTVDGRRILIVELTGRRLNPALGWYKPDQSLLGAMLQSPEGPAQIRLTGPTETIEANREAFLALVGGIRLDAASSDESSP